MSTDEELEFLADGLTEDILTLLSTNKHLALPARTSVFAFKGQSIDIRQVAEQLGARYVAEGSGENIFIVRRGKLKTPPLTSILEGITRDSGMKIAEDEGIEIFHERILGDFTLNCRKIPFRPPTIQYYAKIRDDISNNESGARRMFELCSVRSLGQILKKVHDVHIVTNENDFLIADEDVTKGPSSSPPNCPKK